MSIKKKTLSREYAMKYLFHFLSLEKLHSLKDEPFDQDLLQFKMSYSEPDEEHPDNLLSDELLKYGDFLAQGALGKKIELQEIIAPKLKKSNFNELDIMTKSILMIGCFEIHSTQLAYQVVVNECVSLANRYSKKENIALINGVLDAIGKQKSS